MTQATDIGTRLQEIRSTLPPSISLVAVSKFHPVEMLEEAYRSGQRDFGESRVQELLTKRKALPDDVKWHFIGHLQTNKVRQLIPFVHLIHSVDSPRLLDEIERQTALCGRDHIDILLEVHVAQEESKSGFSPEELLALIRSNTISERWPHLHFRGLMGMATFTDDTRQIAAEFRQIVTLRQEVLELLQSGEECARLDILSFGMSEDYSIAISEGSNMLRLGSAIFGARSPKAPPQPHPNRKKNRAACPQKEENIFHKKENKTLPQKEKKKSPTKRRIKLSHKRREHPQNHPPENNIQI